MNHRIPSPLKITIISIIVFITTLVWLLHPRDDTTLERSSVRNLRQNQAEGKNTKESDYPYAEEVDGLIIFNEFDYQSYGASDSSKIFAEGVYGLRLTTQGTVVTITPYRHNEAYTAVTKISYSKVNNGLDTLCNDIPLVSFNESTTLDLKGQADGIYSIHVTLNGKYSTDGYVVKKSNIVHTCQAIKHVPIATVSKSLEIFHKYTDGLNPNNYMSLKGLTYPSAGGDLGYVDNVAEIAQFSIDNFSSDVWNDEATVYAMVNWLNKNVAYDTWRTKENNGESRAHALGNYTDPSIFCWQNHVGVCWDYANILAIMCRAQGIPATTIDTPTHTWNIIYLNGRWVSVDVCDTGMYESKTYNGDKSQWTANTIRTWEYYMTFPKPQRAYVVTSVDNQIWTRYKALK